MSAILSPARTRLALPLLALALLAPTAWKAVRGGARETSPSPPAYAYVVDWSGSTAAIRRRLLGAALAEIEALPAGTRVTVFRMGASTQEVYDGAPDGDAEPVAAALARDALPSDAARGTDFPRMTAALRAFSRAFAGRRFLVRVLTDGGDDRAGDRRAEAAYRRDAAALCADPRMAEIAFAGVAPGFREGIRKAFGGAGGRLRVLGPGEGLGG